MTAPARARPISVCIPAHDEARRIDGLLAALSAVDRALADEILVCANGCTDDTDGVVRSAAERDPRVRLLSLSRANKNAAFNALLVAARNDRLAFVDADVRPSPGDLAALRAALDERAGRIVASSWSVPERVPGDPERFLAGLLQCHLFPDFLNGQLYALDRTRLRAAWERLGGPAGIPETAVGEDYWLERSLRPEDVFVVFEVRVRHSPPRWKGALRVMARYDVQVEQVRRQFPMLASPDRSRRARRRQLLGALWSEPWDGAIAMGLAGAALRRIVRIACARELRQIRCELWQAAVEGRGGEVLGSPGRSRPDPRP